MEFVSDEHGKKLTGVKMEINRLEVMCALMGLSHCNTCTCVHVYMCTCKCL